MRDHHWPMGPLLLWLIFPQQQQSLKVSCRSSAREPQIWSNRVVYKEAKGPAHNHRQSETPGSQMEPMLSVLKSIKEKTDCLVFCLITAIKILVCEPGRLHVQR